MSLGDGYRLVVFRITSPARRFISDIQAAKLDQFDRFSIKQGVFQDRKNGGALVLLVLVHQTGMIKK